VSKTVFVLLSLLLAYGIYRFNSVQMQFSTHKYVVNSTTEVVGKKLLVIPGSGGEYTERPNFQFNGRMEKGIALLKADTTLLVLLSGFHDGKEYAETTAMRNVLVRNGISPERIAYDSLAHDTFQTILNLQSQSTAQTFIFVTQKEHLSRTLWMANSLGFKVAGIVAPGKPGGNPAWLKGRERMASVKSRLNVYYFKLTGQRSKFLY
jgi:vancomycin permeability regulator SanA